MACATRSDTTPDPEVPGYTGGGYWVSVCLTCGWEKEGRYPPGQEAKGLRLANLQGDVHETRSRLQERRSHG